MDSGIGDRDALSGLMRLVATSLRMKRKISMRVLYSELWANGYGRLEIRLFEAQTYKDIPAARGCEARICCINLYNLETSPYLG